MTIAQRGIIGLLLLAAVLIQVSLLAELPLLHARASLLVLVVASVALLTDSITGAASGFLAGLLLAIATVEPVFGSMALVLTLVGYVVGRWGEALVVDTHPVPPLVAGIVGTVAVMTGEPVVRFLVTASGGISGPSPLTVASAALLTAMLAVPVYMAVRWVLALTTIGAANGGAKSGAR